MRGGASLPPTRQGVKLARLDEIQRGQHVFGFDGGPHRVLQVVRTAYRGPFVGLRHLQSEETLWLAPDHRVLAKLRPRTLGGNRDWSGVPLNHIGRRKNLRKGVTPAESLLWSRLRRNQTGVKFRRQHPIGPYIADFYSREAHLVVEIDGDSHFTDEGMGYDAERDGYLRSLGLEVVRFTNADVHEDLESLIGVLRGHLRSLCGHKENVVWLQARSLEPGDLIFFGLDQMAASIESVESGFVDEEVCDLDVEDVYSYITEVCTVCNRRLYRHSER